MTRRELTSQCHTFAIGRFSNLLLEMLVQEKFIIRNVQSNIYKCPMFSMEHYSKQSFASFGIKIILT